MGDALRASLHFDEGPGTGLGHRRRMEALGSALRAGGADVELTAAAPSNIDADVVVVDSYAWRADARQERTACLLVAVDDLRRDLAVDLVVDPSPQARAEHHPRARHRLLGVGYALLGLTSGSRPPRRAEVDRILVATGATDACGVGADVAAELRVRLPGAEVRLVLGPWGSKFVPTGVVGVEAGRAGLEAELTLADLVVTGAGVTLLEALHLGAPAVAIVLADNQRATATGMAAAHAVTLATAKTASEVAASLAADPRRRRRQAAAGRRLVDGRGAARVAREIVLLLERTAVRG